MATLSLKDVPLVISTGDKIAIPVSVGSGAGAISRQIISNVILNLSGYFNGPEFVGACCAFTRVL
jgi:hypothetical protein